jgi:hypothetical protein
VSYTLDNLEKPPREALSFKAHQLEAGKTGAEA